jgi:acyl-CoA thioesterase-1
MKHLAGASFCFLLLMCLVSCDRDESPAPGPTPAPAASPAPGRSSEPRVVFLGDSLTAGYGLDAEQAFPAVVAELLRRDGITISVVNAGVSGDTTAGGLRRLDWLLKQSPDVIVVGLGGNDGLRGLDLKGSEQNLREIVQKSRAAGARVLLLGMLIPPNYGPEYTTQFREIYPRLAKELTVPLVPFLLEGVGGQGALNQADGIHPTAQGQRIVAGTVAKHLRPVVEQVRQGR